MKGAQVETIEHLRRKLSWESDAADVFAELEAAAREGREPPIVVVDARTTEAYAAGHVPGALNLPHREMTAASTAALPRDRVVVTYCDGLGCNASTKGALKLAELGFEVKEMPGGLDWWRRDGLPVAIGQEPGSVSVSFGGGAPPPAPPGDRGVGSSVAAAAVRCAC